MSKPVKATSTKKVTKPAKEALPALQPRKVLVNGPQKQVFIIDDANDIEDVATLQCITLQHPKHGRPARYLHSSKHVWEIQRVYQPPSSWIMAHSIQEDGSFYIATKIDPLFLVLPLLERGRKKTADHDGNFMQLDQLISKADFPVNLLGPGGAIGSQCTAHTLCDLRDGWNEPVLRLSDAKVITWLRAKVERMRHAFKKVPSLQHHYTKTEREETPEQEKERLEKQANELAAAAAAAAEAKANEQPTEEKKESESSPTTDPTATSSAAIPTTSTTASATVTPSTPPASSSLKQSLAFISEYLPAAFFTLLLESYSLKHEDVFEKKKAVRRDWEATGSGGKISADIDTSRPAGAPSGSAGDKRKADKPVVSSAQKKLATAAKGTKSLASFFGAPKKASA